MERSNMSGMDDKQYRVLFIAEERGDQDLAQVVDHFFRVFRLDTAVATKLCSGGPVPIKSGIDHNTAMKYRSAIVEAGGIGWIEPMSPNARGYVDRRDNHRRTADDRRSRSRIYTETADRRQSRDGRRYPDKAKS